jgi:hypothetical protein
MNATRDQIVGCILGGAIGERICEHALVHGDHDQCGWRGWPLWSAGACSRSQSGVAPPEVTVQPLRGGSRPPQSGFGRGMHNDGACPRSIIPGANLTSARRAVILSR